MNAQTMAKMAYGGAAAPIRTAQATEYEIIARITHRLRAAIPAARTQFAELASALHENRRLWLTLASDVSDPANGLPPALRARLFYLAEFTRVHTSRVLDGSAGAQVLVDINTAVLRGLRAQGEQK